MPQSQQPSRKNSCISRGLSLLASPEEYDALLAEFRRDTNSFGIKERTFCNDAANCTWEIREYRQLKAKLLAQSFYDEVSALVLNSLIDARIEEMNKEHGAAVSLKQLPEDDPETVREIRQRAHDAAVRWCESEEGRNEVCKLLKELGADVSEIEVKACMEYQDEFEHIDRSIASLENRRNNALRMLVEYRAISARKVHAVPNRLIEGGASIPHQITDQT